MLVVVGVTDAWPEGDMDAGMKAEGGTRGER